MKALHTLVLSMGMLACLAGCATTNRPSALYLLPQPAPGTAVSSSNSPQPLLQVERVVLSPYLAEQGIVYQTAPNQVVIASNNRWAAPLAAQVTSVLRRTLQTVLTGVKVVQAGTPDPRQALHLHVHVDQFQGRYDGLALVAGNWTLRNPQGQRVAAGNFRQTATLQKDGYPTLVKSLGRAWQQACQQIARAINTQSATFSEIHTD